MKFTSKSYICFVFVLFLLVYFIKLLTVSLIEIRYSRLGFNLNNFFVIFRFVFESNEQINIILRITTL